MSKKVKAKITSPENSSPTVLLSNSQWLQAIEDARLKIQDHRKRIRLLEEAMQTFEEYAKVGERWPGK